GVAVDPRPVDASRTYRVEAGGTVAVIGPRETKRYDLVLDVSSEPNDREFDLQIEAAYWNGFQNDAEWAGVRVDGEMKEVSLEIRFPRARPFLKYSLSSYPPGERGKSKLAPTEAQVDRAHRSLRWNIVN